MGFQDALKENGLSEVFHDIVQVGIVVEDLEKAKAGMRQLFGMEPDAESRNVYKGTWYRGTMVDAPVDVAFYNGFNIQLEYLAPVGDADSVWHDYLIEGPHHGHALHHLRFDVEDNDEATRLMESAGVKKYMEGQSFVDPSARFTYYDSVDLVGFVIEAVTKPK